MEGGGNKYMVAGLPYIWLSWLHYHCKMFDINLVESVIFSAFWKTDNITAIAQLMFGT